MASAVMDTLSVDIAAGAYQFRATGSRVKFPGFLAVYRDLPENGEGQEGWLPDLTAGETLEVVALDPQQHFTQPPPRYTEASLVRALEERGIGRPSTYAPTIETIKRRGYVKPINRRLHPTDLGKLVNDLLVEHFGRDGLRLYRRDGRGTGQRRRGPPGLAEGGGRFLDAI